MISINIASHKAREKNLKRCLESILESNTKPDVINVYLNDYKAPAWLKKMPVNVEESPKGDLGASAKFYWSEGQKEGVYLTMDDDLVVDKRYIGYLVDSAYRYPSCIVGLHGTIYGRMPIESYYHDATKQIIYAYAGNDKDRVVDMLGTGCLAFRASNALKPVLEDFPKKNMTDPYLYKYAQESITPLICLIRETGFVKEQNESQHEAIWKAVAKNDKEQTEVINSVDRDLWLKSHKHTIEKLQIPSNKFGDAALEWSHFREIIKAWNNTDDLLVEFGSGLSTKYLSELGPVLSFEHDNKYANELTELRPIKKGWYGLTAKDKQLIKKASVVLIDGPTGKSGYRYNLPISILPKDATIFVDDCQRKKDLELAKKIADKNKMSLKLIKGKEKTLAVLCKS